MFPAPLPALLALLLLAPASLPLPSGAPDCAASSPMHAAFSPQPGPVPYSVTCVRRTDGVYRIVIGSNGGREFKGFRVVVRNPEDGKNDQIEI